MSHSDPNLLKVFAGQTSRDFGMGVCAHLGIPLGQSTTLRFPDGETIVKIEEDVRGRDCYVIQSTCQPVNNHQKPIEP